MRKKARHNSQERFLGAIVIGVILVSFFTSSLSMLIRVASAAPSPVTLNPKWTKTGLGDGLWEGGFVIGDVVKSNPGEEVCFATDSSGGTVYCLDGRTGATIWTYRDSGIYAYAQTTLYDLDGDGNLEVCVPLYYIPGLLVLRSNGALWWRTTIANAGTTMGTFAAADVNKDGKLEIFHGSQNVEAGADGKFVGRITKLSYNGKILAQTFNWRACSGGVSIADADNDGVFEVYTGDRDMYMNDGDYGRGIRSFWADNLTERWCMPDILSSSQCPDLADVNGDGKLEVIASDMSGGVVVLNATTGSAKPWPLQKTGSIGVPGHYQTTVCDIDYDGHLELICADGTHSNSRISNYSNKFVIYDLVTGIIEQEFVVGQCKFSPTVADLNGDGQMDIIACNMTAIIVFTYNNATKTYVKIGERGNLLSGLMYAMVQDIDVDGLLEVVVARGSGSSAALYAFDTAARKPALRARSEIKWYSEYRRGVAEYVAPPGASSQMSSAMQPGASGIGSSTFGSEAIVVEPKITADVLKSFGNTNAGTSISNVAQYLYGSRYQIPEDGTARNVTLYISERNGENRPLKVAIYQDSSGNPTTLLAQGANTVPAGFSGWFTVSLSSYPKLSANNYYWLVANAIASTKNVSFNYSAGATNQGLSGTTSYASFPPSTLSPSINSRAYSIYCSYTIAEEGSSSWILEQLANGDVVCRNSTYVNPSVPRVFNWYVNDYKHPTTSTPESLTRLLLTFDKNDPNAVQDYSPYGNNGLVHGATWTSQHGGAYVFDGLFDYISIPDGGSGYYNGYPQPRTGDLMSDGNKTEMSLEMWVYLTQNQTDVRFVSKIPSYEIGIGTDGKVFAGVFRQKGNDDTELGYLGYTSVKGAALTLNTWQHVALTYKDSVGLKLFLNGVLVASANAQGNIHCSSGIPLVIGWFDYFKGMIDDVRLYSQCLSDQQINQEYLEQSWTNTSTIKSGQMKGQEKWMCNIIDNGKSTWATAGGLNYIVIPNNVPVANNLLVGPRSVLPPINTDDLTASYVYQDPDENVELGSQIRWYDTGVLQSDLNDKLIVPASRTSVGDEWYFTIRPRDGKDFGATATSPTVTIAQNNRPTIQGTLNLQKQSGNLVITPTTSDPDGPTPTRNIYNWRIGGTSISNLQLPFDTDNMISGAKDYSPTGNNGVVSGATWISSGVIGGAYHFDGTDVITCADNNLGGDAAGTWTALTVEFWIKVDGWLNRTRIVAKKVSTSSSGSYMIGFQSTPDTSISNGNQMFFSVTTNIGTVDSWDDANPSTHINNFLTPGNWYYIVCTYKSGPGITVYINGKQTVNVPWNGTITTATEFVPGDEPLFIGSDGSGDARRFLVGTLDELVIYNRALSSQQVNQGFQQSKNGQSNTSTIVAQETSSGQTWTCMVTPNDKYGDGTPVLSTSQGT